MKKYLWWIGAALVLAPLGAPFLKADRLAPALTASLERALQRKVEVGEVRLHLLTGPGFTLSDVVIHEDPAVSAEPLAYVTSLVVRLRLLSLLSGKMELSALRLEEPSVNLMRTGESQWNVQSLLKNTGGGELPDLEVRGGRLNFKIDGVKSVYYFTNADIDFSAESGARAFDVWFRGEPARTDRTAQGFGRFTGRGRWLRPEGAEPRLEIDYQLEPSAVEELSKLLAGRDLGLNGVAESRGRLAGPISGVEVAGRLDLKDLHYWSQSPKPGQWRVGYKGKWNLTGEQLTVATEGERLPFRASAELMSYLSAPRWRVEVHPEEMPLGLAVGWLRLEQGLQVDGKLSGGLMVANDKAAAGTFAVKDFALLREGVAVMKAAEIPVTIEEGKLHLEAAAVEYSAKESAALSYDWDWKAGEMDGSLQAKAVAVETLQMLAGAMGQKPPFLMELKSGTVRGQVRVKQGEWTGAFALTEAKVVVPELAEPVELVSANVELRGERLAARGIRAKTGKLNWEGEYRYETGQARPHRFDVRIAQANAEELERLLTPALQRERGFVARTLGIGEGQVPEWLASRRAEGGLRVGKLEAGKVVLTDVRAGVQWDASRVSLRDVKFGWEGAEVTGSLGVNLQKAKPEYAWEGRAVGVSWQGGKVTAKGTADSRGMGLELAKNLRAKGEWEGEQMMVGERVVRKGKSKFGLRVEGGVVKLDLGGVEAEMLDGIWVGKGVTERDGKLVVDLTSEGKEMRLVGTAAPVELR